MPQEDTLDIELTVRENLIIYGRYFDLAGAEAGRRADELLEFVQLTDRAKTTVEPLSGGMKRRLTIARSLINEPDLLLLDEPTTGLDPQARHLLWDRLYRLKQQRRDPRPHDPLHGRGRAAVRPARRHGQGADRGRGLAARADRPVLDPRGRSSCASRSGVQRDASTAELDGLAERIERLPDRVLLYTDDGEAAAAAVHARGLRPETVLVRRSSLEDVFLRLTGRSLIE